MNPEFYRQHEQEAVRRAFVRGANASRAGKRLSANPYRKVVATRRARRFSWTEAYTRAWAAGWHKHQEGTA